MTGDQHSHPHSHGNRLSQSADIRLLAVALALLLAFMASEVVFAILSGSLALLADAGHMLTDAGALAASIWAARLYLQPPKGSWTFGLKRAEILSAQANGISLLIIAAIILVEAIQRLLQPPTVQGSFVTGVAAAGIVVNLIVISVLARANRESLNVEGSFQHIATDLFAFLATLAAGIVILFTGFNRADAIASLVVVTLMLRASVSLLKTTGRILLEGGPPGTDIETMGRELASQPHVAEVHDVHLWTITSGFPALAAHVLVDPDIDCHAVRRNLEDILRVRYSITHTTLQVDHLSDHTITAEELIATRPGRPASDPGGE